MHTCLSRVISWVLPQKKEKNAVNSLSVVEWADALGSTKNMNRNHRAQINVLQLA